jgi:DNA-binding response OmpR family regulator
MLRKKVLVVDDDEDLRDSIATLLRRQGYDVEVARDGREALDLVAVGLPGAILLDMRMPVMNGWEFARIFRQRYDHLTPIIVLTAASDVRARAVEVGAEDWLGKPFELSELYQTVDRNIVRCR